MSAEREATTNDRRIGQRVRARRLEIAMSQERLAELLGVTFQQVQKYEKGVNRIAASRLFDIAQALELPVARFFDGLTQANGCEAPAPFDSSSPTREGARMAALIDRIKSRTVRSRVVALAEAVAEDAP